MILWQLFLSFIQIGTFSFGGGYATMPLIQNQVIDLYHWLSFSEFTDLITISQMTPGPIAINSATFVGIKIAGIPGAIVATVGCILPSCILVTVIAYFYLKYRHLQLLQNILKYLRPAVVSLIATAGISILICVSGIKIFIESYNVLMDASIDNKTKEKILDITKKYKDIQKVDHFSSTPVGYKYLISLSIYIDGNMSTYDSHAIADKLEKELNALEPIYLAIIHVNPI